MDNLLARFAENFFWMARYMERVENLARILDVNATFARNDAGQAEWFPIVQMQSDEKSFFATHAEASAEAVLPFYLIDRENYNSVYFSVVAARENARSLRHLISLELWSQLNVFYNEVSALKPEDVRLAELSALCNRLKEGCQLHTGIAEGTLYRDQGWYFYALGRVIERADQITRLLDVKYNRMKTSGIQIGSGRDDSQWNALLRSAAAWHAYRRIHHRGLKPADVVSFLLFDRAFPRSVQTCVAQVRELLSGLVDEFGLIELQAVADDAAALDEELGATDVPRLIETGLHDFINDLQVRFGDLTMNLGYAAFFHERPAASPAVSPVVPAEIPAMTQVQTDGFQSQRQG